MKLTQGEKQKLLQVLTAQMMQAADIKTKTWFENYLKGAIQYRGLKTPQVTRFIKDWYRSKNLKTYSLEEQLSLCNDLISSPYAEDKFAGTIYLQQFLLSKLEWQTLLANCDMLFQAGYFYDWSTTDWFCMRVLAPTIKRYGRSTAQVIANWRLTENLWQRRASIVSFRSVCTDRTYHALIKEIIDDLVNEQQRFIQTGIGWVMADMSKVFPEEIESWFRNYLVQLEREVIDRHTKHLPCHQELKQLKRQL